MLSPFVKVSTLLDTEPVIINEPVLMAPVATVTSKVVLSPFVNVITLLTAEAVVKRDPVFTDAFNA